MPMSNDKPRFGVAAESPIDRAIDRAVRDIMRVDPPAGLRRRVMARIEAAPRRSILFPRFTVAAAALAMLLLTIVVLTKKTVPPPASPPEAASRPIPAAPPVDAQQPPAAVAEAPVTSADRPSTGPTVEAIRMPRVANVFGSSSGASATALRDAPERSEEETAAGRFAEPAGALAPIAVRPLTVPSITVEPLRITTIAPPK